MLCWHDTGGSLASRLGCCSKQLSDISSLYCTDAAAACVPDFWLHMPAGINLILLLPLHAHRRLLRSLSLLYKHNSDTSLSCKYQQVVTGSKSMSFVLLLLAHLCRLYTVGPRKAKSQDRRQSHCQRRNERMRVYTEKLVAFTGKLAKSESAIRHVRRVSKCRDLTKLRDIPIKVSIARLLTL